MLAEHSAPPVRTSYSRAPACFSQSTRTSVREHCALRSMVMRCESVWWLSHAVPGRPSTAWWALCETPHAVRTPVAEARTCSLLTSSAGMPPPWAHSRGDSGRPSSAATMSLACRATSGAGTGARGARTGQPLTWSSRMAYPSAVARAIPRTRTNWAATRRRPPAAPEAAGTWRVRAGACSSGRRATETQPGAVARPLSVTSNHS
mmetsp:Transcript_17858/g.55903  ORF Transcript_17858/g.55903 Transcript_17858/m.55903 type:complete len:205 (-) Transcript_17858:2088-2702(-)